MVVHVALTPVSAKGRDACVEILFQKQTTVFWQTFFRQDGILSVIPRGWWFCFRSQQILWKISLALPSILWLFLAMGNYRILVIIYFRQKQLLCCFPASQRGFSFFFRKSSPSEEDYQQSLFCLSPSCKMHATCNIWRKREIACSLHQSFSDSHGRMMGQVSVHTSVICRTSLRELVTKPAEWEVAGSIPEARPLLRV